MNTISIYKNDFTNHHLPPKKVPVSSLTIQKNSDTISYATAITLRNQILYSPNFKSNIFSKHKIYDKNKYFPATPMNNAFHVARIGLIEDKNNQRVFKTTKDISEFIDILRNDEDVQEFQFTAATTLAKNPKFKNPNDITKLVSQINTIERGELFLEQIKKYSNKYPDISAPELVAIIPRLEPNKLDIQDKFIDKIYMQKYTNAKVDIDGFSELLSSINDNDTADIQISFFQDLMLQNKMTPQIAMNLVANIENKENGILKKYTAIKLMNKGIEAEDLPILIPKIKNVQIAKLNSSMADYFIGKKGMNSKIASRIMSNISEPRVFNMQKNIIEDMNKLRKFEDEDTLKILGDIQTPEMAELKSAVIGELSKIDRLNGHDIMHIVTNVDTVYGAEVKVKTAKKLSKIDELSGDNIGYIVAGCHNEESSRVKCRASEELVQIPGMRGKAITTIVSRLLKDEVANLQIEAVKELTNDKKFDSVQISKIVREIRNIDYKNAKMKAKDDLIKNDKLDSDSIVKILNKINGESKDKYLMACIDRMTNDDEFDKDDITKIATTMAINKHTCNKYIDYFRTIPKEIRKEINDYSVIQDFSEFKDKKYLNKLERRDLVNALIKHNSSIFDGNANAAARKLYPFLPSDNEEFCQLLPVLISSIYKPSTQISTKNYIAQQQYNKNINNLCHINNDFLKLDLEDDNNIPTLKYKRADFIKDVSRIIKNFSPEEQKRITDEFEFVIENNKKGETIMKGFPKIPKRYTNIYVNPQMHIAAMNVSNCIRKYTQDNKVIFPNATKETNELFNEIFNAIPELYTIVEKKQNDWHDFDTFTHTLRVLQEVAKNERFQKLNEKDKTILATAALLHDISKEELVVDKGHSLAGAYDAHQISRRLDFTDTERSKFFAIIRNHEWLKYYNKEGVSELQKIERAKTVAFTLREGNAFDLVSILSEADLKGMKKGGTSYELFKDAQKEGNSEVARYVRDLQRTAIALPQHKLPKASELVPDGDIIRETNIGGIKNKVIYLNKNMGKGSLPFDKNLDPNDFNLLVHALDSEKNSLIFQRMDEVDSDTLISASYVNLAKGNWKTFRQQGYILDVDSDNIHAAYFKDFGSGLSKNIDRLKLDYLYEGYFKPQRDYISQKIKEKLHISDESYKSLYQDIKNKSLPEIRKEYPFVSAAIKQIYMEMQGGEYTYGRNYNEVLVTRPKIQGVFAYERSITQVPKYLRKYASDNDIPVIIFLD